MARADAGESLRLTSNSPVGHPSILEQNPPAASMSPPVNQSGTVSSATPRAHCMGNPRPQSSPKDHLLVSRLVFLDQRIAARTLADAGTVTTTFHPPSSVGRLAIPLTTFAAAAAVLWFTGPRLAHVAARLADQSGLGGTFVGTTLVALTTSLPELVTAIVAVRAGAYDLAIGNTFGSNAFNMVIFLPLDMAHDGSLFAAVAPSHALTAFAVVVATAVAVLGQLYRIEGRIPLCEPDSLLVLLIVVGALLLVYRLS